MKHTAVFIILACLVIFTACSPSKGNKRGHEFMPDMVHPTGYEANVFDYYYYNRWGTEAEYKTFTMPRHSVPGTVARGEISIANAADPRSRIVDMDNFEGLSEGSMALTPNGSVPYYYGDTEEERARATKEITQNPFPITEKGMANGKLLFDIYCGICHGEKGDGKGFLVREEDPVKGIVAGIYPAAPANFLLDTFVNSSAGRLYHGIMKGKNVMGSYADKLSYSERWEVIHYIRSLQAVSKKLEYSPVKNTFNKEATSWSVLEAGMKKEMPEMVKDSTGKKVAGENPKGNTQHETNVHK